jgi:hypothetical protein
MQIILKPASNGLIKTIYEPSINGAGSEYECDVVYNFQNANSKEEKLEFINSIISDLGIESGSAKDKDQLKIQYDWGSNYKPSKKEIEDRIESLEREKQQLAQLARQKNE